VLNEAEIMNVGGSWKEFFWNSLKSFLDWEIFSPKSKRKKYSPLEHG
jgi:hypothetical protein